MNINKRTSRLVCCRRHLNNFMLNAQFTFYVYENIPPLADFLAAASLNLSYSLLMFYTIFCPHR